MAITSEEYKYLYNTKNKTAPFNIGVEMPDTLITVNGTNDYKLLDAPNLDWNNTHLFWAEMAGRRGIWDSNVDETNPTGRDIRNSFYPNYTWPSFLEAYDGKETLTPPSWAATGNINHSDEMLDILNYLLWRVLSLDYFADNWDNINTQVVEYNLLSWYEGYSWWHDKLVEYGETNEVTINPDDYLTNNFYTIPNGQDISSFRYIINPNNPKVSDFNISSSLIEGHPLNNLLINAIPIASNDPNSPIQTIYNENIDKLHYAVKSNNPAKIESLVPNNNSVVCGPVIPVIQINIAGNESLSTYIFEFALSTTGRFNQSNKTYKQQKEELLMTNGLPNTADGGETTSMFFNCGFDAMENTGDSGTEVKLYITQAANLKPGNKFGRTENKEYMTFTISKVSNLVKNVTLINNATEEAYNEGQTIYLPYWKKEEDKYEIVINYGEESEVNETHGIFSDPSVYGIYPLFIIKNETTKDVKGTMNDDGTFTGDNTVNESGDSNGYGSIIFDNETNKYYYVPPTEKSNDMIIRIYCLFYYKDDSNLPLINPCLRSFTVNLVSDVVNEIIFYDGKRTIKVFDSSIGIEKSQVAPNQNYVDFSGYKDWYLPVETPEYDETTLELDNSTHQYYYMDGGEYVQAIGQYDPNVDYYIEDDNNRVPYTYAIKSLVFNDNNNTFKLTNLNNIVARSIYSPDVHYRFCGVIPSNTINRDWAALQANGDILNEPEYFNGFDYISNTAENIYEDLNTKVDDITLPQTPHEILTGENTVITPELKKDNVTLKESKNVIITDTLGNFEGTLFSVPTIKLDTDFFNLEYHYEAASTNAKALYNLTLKKSTAILPYENGVITCDNNAGKFNADNDYYYLVFEVYCPEGTTTWGVSYKECNAYYFLKIVRKNTEKPLVAFQTFNELTHNIEYTLNNGDTDDTIEHYNLLNIVKKPIYLNRLLNETALNQNKKFRGKQWWYLYGLRENVQAIAWSDVNIWRDCFQIYNEGDECYFIELEDPNLTYNDYPIEYNKTVYENPGSGSESETITKYLGKDSNGKISSGPFLYAKFLKRIDSTNNALIIPCESNYIAITLSMTVGNDPKYTRNEAASYSGFPIYKKEYDFKFAQETINPETGLVEFKTITSEPVQITNIPLYDEANGILNINQQNTNWTQAKSIYLISNEFGTPDEEETRDDILKILHSFNVEYDINGIDENKINAHFIATNNCDFNMITIAEETNGTIPTITIDKTKPLHFCWLESEHNESSDNGRIRLIGYKPNNVIPASGELIETKIKITYDHVGIYGDKELVVNIRLKKHD